MNRDLTRYSLAMIIRGKRGFPMVVNQPPEMVKKIERWLDYAQNMCDEYKIDTKSIYPYLDLLDGCGFVNISSEAMKNLLEARKETPVILGGSLLDSIRDGRISKLEDKAFNHISDYNNNMKAAYEDRKYAMDAYEAIDKIEESLKETTSYSLPSGWRLLGVNSSQLIIISPKIEMKSFDSTTSMNMGKFIVRVNLNDDRWSIVPWVNNRKGTNTRFHPHYSLVTNWHTNQGPCYGNAYSKFQDAMVGLNLTAGISIIENHLSTYNPESPFERVKNFKLSNMVDIEQYCGLLRDLSNYSKSEECFRQDFSDICQNIWDMAVRRTSIEPDTLDNYNTICKFITTESSYLCNTTFGRIAMCFKGFKEPLEWVNPYFKQEFVVEAKPIDITDEKSRLESAT